MKAKTEHLLVRIFQVLTVLGVVAIVFLLITKYDILNRSGGDAPDTLAEENSAEPAKRVQRPRSTGNQSYEKLISDGDAAHFAGEDDRALIFYQEAAEKEPREAKAYERIGDLYFEQKNYSSAQRNFELAATLSESSEQLQIKIARTLLGQRKILEARTVLNGIQSQEVFFLQGAIASFLNEQEESKRLLNESLTAGTNQKYIQDAQRILDAYKIFDLTQGGKIEFLQAMIAKAFSDAGEFGLAIELSFDALKHKHDYRDVWIILGHAFLNERKWLDAEDAMKKAIELDAEHASAYFFRGIARKELGNRASAKEDFETALRAGWEPKIFAQQHLAELNFAEGDLDAAFRYSRDVVKTDPTNIERFIRPIALAIDSVNKPQDALEIAKLGLSTHPDSALANSLRGWAELANGNTKDARTYLQRALTLDNGLESAYLNLGKLERAEERYVEALRNFEIAASLAEKNNNQPIRTTAEFLLNELRAKMDSGEIKIKETVEVPTATPPPERIPLPAAPPPAPQASLSLL
ncbi:hypothetical protein COV82_01250 [Candidatus Peregrinibacteria bacterium CG11_big_fil_rev_8_21_14_0_20_46_8]|nr:MAG: hypothetical protein COV82_01250 [Candidatus Peregrinibacteria bacterium CG11_big_fil_rev_8_21_14_0_20_46_8]